MGGEEKQGDVLMSGETGGRVSLSQHSRADISQKNRVVQDMMKEGGEVEGWLWNDICTAALVPDD